LQRNESNKTPTVVIKNSVDLDIEGNILTRSLTEKTKITHPKKTIGMDQLSGKNMGIALPKFWIKKKYFHVEASV